MSVAPKCRQCGRPLRKRTYREEVPLGTILKKGDTIKIGDTDCVIEEVTRTKPSTAPGMMIAHIWCGTWGGYGDNRFCNIRCGWLWACRHCPQ